MCQDEDYPLELRLPLADGSCDLDDFPDSTESTTFSSSVNDARSYVNFSQSSDIPLAYEDWCQDPSTCSCNDGGDPSEAMCNWDGGAAIECGNFVCVGGDFDGASCSVPEEGDPDMCAPGGGYCAGSCQGGPNAGQQCGTDDPDDVMCEPNTCANIQNCLGETGASLQECLDLPPLYRCRANEPEYTSGIVTTIGNAQSAISRLSQIFAKVYDVVEFSDGYDDIREVALDQMFSGDGIAGEFTYAEDLGDWDMDTRGVRDGAEGYVPEVWSIGECNGTQCYEGEEGKFSVNETDSGIIEGEGSKRVTVAFFTFADTNQMPIRRVVVDWGDNVAGIGGGNNPWPFGSYSGSIADNNFYKNHRGLSPISNEEQCSSEADTFGESPNACSNSYVAFTHDYTCSTGRLQQLSGRACLYADDGRILN